jgi:hypothetical protein
MEDLQPRISIRIAGNTCIPALLALRVKGYRVWLDYHQTSTDVANPSYQSDYQAEQDGAYFSATTPEELLGLVAMWEVRGDEWRFKPEDDDIYDEVHDAARTFDCDGNEVFEQ